MTSSAPSPLPSSPTTTNNNNHTPLFKFRRSPLSLFFPSFNRSTASTTSSTDKSPTSPLTLEAPGRRAKFRNANSMDTTRSEEEGKPKKNGYRALLTPEPPFAKIISSTTSFSSNENIRNGIKTKVSSMASKPSKSVSFQDLIVYPAAIHQAIQSLSSPRKSISLKMTSLSINSNLSLAAASAAETPKIKRSFSNYYIRCKFI